MMMILVHKQLVILRKKVINFNMIFLECKVVDLYGQNSKSTIAGDVHDAYLTTNGS